MKSFARELAVRSVMFAALLVACTKFATAQTQHPPHTFTPIVDVVGTERTGGEDPWIIRSRSVEIDAGVFLAAAIMASERPRIELPVFDDTSLTLRVQRADIRALDDLTIYAVHPRVIGSFATITVIGDSVSGFISIPQLGRFTIRNEGPWLHRIDHVDPGHMPHCAVGAEHEVRRDLPAMQRANDPEPIDMTLGEEMTVLKLYAVVTPEALKAAGQLEAVEALLQTDVATLNTILENSVINMAVKLVGTDVVLYSEQGIIADVEALRDEDLLVPAAIATVHEVRALYCADLVTMVVSYPLGSACGVAYVMQNPSPLFADSAFSVVRLQCMPSTTLAHEIGHNLGCAHDHFAATAPGSYPYSHGHRYAVPSDKLTPDDYVYATVMTYPPYDEAILHFSNPRVQYPEGYPTGIAPGPPEQADNARTIINNLPYARMFGQMLEGAVCEGNTWHVPDDFPTIQAAIDAAEGGDIIIVAPGVYPENINLLGKKLNLHSTDPTDEGVVASTVIDGQQLDTVVKCHSGETSSTVINGFTIRNGSADNGGGVSVRDSSPSISNCVIMNNEAAFSGGGMYINNGGPLIYRCNISSNSSALHGGGIFSTVGSPTLIDCTLSDNEAISGRGGAVYAWGGSIVMAEQTRIENNQSMQGGGAIYSEFTSVGISRSQILNNSSSRGGGWDALGGSSSVYDSVIEQNQATLSGGGIALEAADVQMNLAVIQDNIVTSGHGGGLYILGGEQQINQSTIASNEAGKFAGGLGGGIYVRDGELQLNESAIEENVAGADGGGVFVLVDEEVDPSQWIVPVLDSTSICQNVPNNIAGPWNNAGGTTICALEVDLNVPSDFPTIQSAINAANDGDVIVVAPGVYPERINLLGKAIYVRSFDPTDEAIVQATIIDGESGGVVVRFESGETLATRLSGFTITGGAALHGAGIRVYASSPTIEHCIVQGNAATSAGGGMAVFNSQALLRNTAFNNNSAHSSGGGLYIETSNQLIIQNCSIDGNHSNSLGGGIATFTSNHNMVNLTLTNNTAGQWGGGMFNGGGGTPGIQNAQFVNNNAKLGGGLYSAAGSAPRIGVSLFCENAPTNIHGPWTDLGGNDLAETCPPENNSPANPQPIGNPIETIIGSFTGATSNGTSSCDPGSVDVFYSYTVLAGPATLSLNTCGSSGDTAIAVFNSSGAEVGCNAACLSEPCGPPDACLDLSGLSDGTYLIRISRASALAADLGSDQFQLHIHEKELTFDLTGDGVVDVLDLLELLAFWGPCGGCIADFNSDEAVDVLDLLLLLANWG